jgi:hypothetical protein
MNRWPILLVCVLLSCGEKRYTAEECRSLTLTVVQRCFGGNLQSGKYVGDLQCWPFSRPQRMHGVWLVAMEASMFAPNATRVTPEAPPDLAWLQTDLKNRPEIVAAGQKAGNRAYLIDLLGRQSLCDGNFGHFGSYGREVIVDRIYSIHPIPVPRN